MSKTKTREVRIDQLEIDEESVTAAPIVDDKGRTLLGGGVVLNDRTVSMLKRAAKPGTTVIIRKAADPDHDDAEPDEDDTPQLAELERMFAPHADNALMTALLQAARDRLLQPKPVGETPN